MKKIIAMVIAMSIVFSSITAFAESPETAPEDTVSAYNSTEGVIVDGGLQYKELEDGTLEVSCPDDKKSTITTAEIKSEVNGKKVTRIGDSAFYNCQCLESVTIPESVTEIGISAFCWCSNMTTVSMPKGDVYIDWLAFSSCESIQSITLPRKLYFDDRVFSGSKIKNVYYGGTANEWKGIYERGWYGNNALFNADIHYALQDKQYDKVKCGKVSAHTEYSGSNVGKNNYNYYWASRVSSYLSKISDGFMRVQFLAVDSKILVEYYDDNFILKSSELVDYELPLFGGFYETENNYYVLSGQENPEEDNSTEVFRLTKYDKDWNRLGAASLYGANTTIPFEAGCARMAHKGNKLVVRTCHQMYKSSDGLNHQANLTFIVDTDKMIISDSRGDVANIGIGYCSHSFNQFVEIDDNYIVSIDHGDAYPRCIVLCKYFTDVSTGNLGGCDSVNMFPISGIRKC